MCAPRDPHTRLKNLAIVAEDARRNMSQHERRETERLRKRWDERAKRYDRWYETFEGAVEHHVEWELLKEHLPRDKGARILDAAGGTGRITLPLAKMGYTVTLCDISPGMLGVARQKLLREQLLNRVEIVGCDVRDLRFSDKSFDFVLCWDGMSEPAKAAKELVRVTKKGGRISIFLMNKVGAAIRRFGEDPSSALALLRSEQGHAYDEEEKRIAVNVDESIRIFEKEGIKVIDVYAVCGMLRFLSIPQKVGISRKWSKRLFRQATEILLRLSREPSVKGLSRHLVVYGERI
jgi:ubiquinone/menaquinone biosynthesis C-methylase UbiE